MYISIGFIIDLVYIIMFKRLICTIQVEKQLWIIRSEKLNYIKYKVGAPLINYSHSLSFYLNKG